MSATPEKELFTIGSIAQSFGISDNTIRRMEAAGLLKPALIKESGYRYYDTANISRIKMILTLRSFGLVYDDMRTYFEDPGDFTPVYAKLYERKLLLDVLLENARSYMKPENPDEIFLLEHKEMEFFRRTYPLKFPVTLEQLDELSSQAFRDAIREKYPIDYNKPLTFVCDCMDYNTFNPLAMKELTLMVPLRHKVDLPDAYTLPPAKILSLVWYYGITQARILENLNTFMKEHNLKQCGPLSGTFEIGKHAVGSIDSSKYLFHVIIPVES